MCRQHSSVQWIKRKATWDKTQEQQNRATSQDSITILSLQPVLIICNHLLDLNIGEWNSSAPCLMGGIKMPLCIFIGIFWNDLLNIRVQKVNVSQKMCFKTR